MPSAVKSRRKVISTRSPMATVVGVDVGELDGQAAAAVEVDDGEHDRRARRVDQLVDGEGDDRALARRPWAPAPCRRCRRRPSRPGPAAGGWRRSSRSREPTNPNFQSSLRAAAEADGPRRLGAAGRLDGEHALARPGTCRRAPGRRPPTWSATVRAGAHGGDRLGGPEQRGRRRRRPATTSATTWPGSACSSSGGEQQAGLGGAGVADGGARGRRPRCRRRRACRRRPAGRPWVPATTSDGRPRRRRCRRRPARPSSASRAERRRSASRRTCSSHCLERQLARRPPPVEELSVAVPAAEELGEDRRRRRRRRPAARRRRRRRRPRRRCRAARCACRPVTTQRGRPPRESAARRPPAAERTAPPRSNAAVTCVGQPQRGVDGGGVGLVDVGRGDGGEPQPVGAAASVRPQRQPRRLDAHGGGVLVVGGDRAGAPPAALADDRRDLAPIEPPVRQVGTPGEDPSHGGEHTGGTVRYPGRGGRRPGDRGVRRLDGCNRVPPSWAANG